MATPDGTDSTGEPADYIAIEFETTDMGVFDELNAEVYIRLADTGHNTVTLDMTVTEYGEIGGVVAGSLTGTFTTAGDPVAGNGTFRMKRIADNTFAP
jgi:hypothetical protein